MGLAALSNRVEGRATGSDFLVFGGTNNAGEIATATTVDKNSGTGYSITVVAGVITLVNSSLNTNLPNLTIGDRITIQKGTTGIAVVIGADVLSATSTEVVLKNPVNAITHEGITVTPDANSNGDTWVVSREKFRQIENQIEAGFSRSFTTATLSEKGGYGDITNLRSTIAFQAQTTVSQAAQLTFTTSAPTTPKAEDPSEVFWRFASAASREPVSVRFVQGNNYYGYYMIGTLTGDGPGSTRSDSFAERSYVFNAVTQPAYCGQLLVV